MNGYYTQVAQQLRKHGFEIVRQGATAHQLWGNGSRQVTVSTNCASRHMANVIMKQAGIAHRF